MPEKTCRSIAEDVGDNDQKEHHGGYRHRDRITVAVEEPQGFKRPVGRKHVCYLYELRNHHRDEATKDDVGDDQTDDGYSIARKTRRRVSCIN